MSLAVRGDDSMFNMLFYGEKHPSVVAFLESERVNADTSFLPHVASFYSTSREVFQRFDNAKAIQLARAAERRVGVIWNNEGIQLYDRMGQFQNPNNVMMNFLMANPRMRRMHQDQRVDGYNGRYVDPQPEAIGWDHYHYRLATSGVYMERPNGKFASWTTEEELAPGDVMPAFGQQINILQSWEHLESRLLAGKEDPSSKTNNML